MGGPLDQWNKIAGSPQGSPPAADYVGCEAGRRDCSEHGTGTEEPCEIKWDYHIVGRRYDGLVMVQDKAHLRQGNNDLSRQMVADGTCTNPRTTNPRTTIPNATIPRMTIPRRDNS